MGIGILLIITSIIILDYRFDVEYFMNDSLRMYFFSCDTNLLPAGIHGAVLVDPPCITEWFSPHYLIDAIFIITTMGGGIVTLVYGLKSIKVVGRIVV